MVGLQKQVDDLIKMIDDRKPTYRQKFRARWMTYFDLLGFQRLVEKRDLAFIIPIYEKILGELDRKAGPKRKYGIDYSWFSDTFIIFAPDDSLESFSLMEQASRLFFRRLILKNIPLRGALTVGELYTQKKKNIFLGQALIDAYEYGEKQNWLGLILTPKVYERLKGTDLDLGQRMYYRRIQDPEVILHPRRENVFAFTMNDFFINDQNKCLQAVRAMKTQAPKRFQAKYKNTEDFIVSSGRFQPVENA